MPKKRYKIHGIDVRVFEKSFIIEGTKALMVVNPDDMNEEYFHDLIDTIYKKGQDDMKTKLRNEAANIIEIISK